MTNIIRMTMKQCIRISAVVSALLLAATAFGQTKTLTGKTEVVTGTVEAIQADSRIVTVKGPKGNYVDIEVPKESKKFANLKVGDKVTARYYENLILRLKAPGEPEPNTAEALAALGAANLAPAAVLAALEDAWRLQQDLTQLLKVALGDDPDPSAEPPAFRALLARAGGARDSRRLRTRLAAARSAARNAYEIIVT